MRKFIRKTKKKLKRININPKVLGLVCVFVVALGFFATKVFASDSTFEIELTNSSSNVYEPGDTVEILAKLNTTEEWSTAKFAIEYDSDYFTDCTFQSDFKEYDGSAIDPTFMATTQPVNLAGNSIRIIGISNYGDVNHDGGIQFGKVSCTLKDDPPTDPTYLSIAEGENPVSHNPYTEYFNADYDDLDFDISDPIEIKIRVPMESWDYSPKSINLDINNKPTEKINITTVPSNATDDPEAEYEDYNPAIITIDENGNVTAVGTGNTTITLTAFGDTPVSIPVDVTAHLNSIALNKETYTLGKGENYTFTVTNSPNPTTDTVTYKWESNSPSVSVDQNGEITANAGGDATITVTAKIDGVESTITDSVLVHVDVPFDNVYADPNEVTLVKGDPDKNSKDLKDIVVYKPDDATRTKTVASWEIDHPEVASISNGVVTAVGKGTAQVTGHVEGGIDFTVDITVEVPITEFTTSPSSADLYIGQNQTITPYFTPAKTDISENTDIEWSSDPEGIVSIDNGVVTALAAGTTTVTAKTGKNNRLESTTEITVYTPINGVQIDSADFILYMNQGSLTKQLSASVNPPGSGMDSDKAISWSIQSGNAATVSNTGLVTAVENGTAVVRATLVADPTKYAEVTVTVETKVESFTITSNHNVVITKGGDSQIETQISPSTATHKNITWSGYNEDIIDVSSTGLIHAKANGNTSLTGTVDGISQTISVSVITPATSVTINEGAASVDVLKNAQTTLTAEMTPDGVTDEIVWTAAAAPGYSGEIVSVDESTGVVTALKAGKAIVTATARQNVYDTIEINVIVHATNFTITDSSLTINKDNTKKISVSVSPEDTTDTITWEEVPGTDGSIVTIDAEGRVTGVKTGHTTVKGTINGIERTVPVTVILAATGVEITGDDAIVMELGDEHQLSANVTPEGSTDSVAWSSYPEGVVTIDSNGKVTAVGTGTTTITADVGNNIKDTISVTVNYYATGVTIDQGSSADVVKGSYADLSATVEPEGSTDSVVWSVVSGSENVTVNPETGRVTGVKAGQAVIKAKAGNFEDTITINVIVHTQGVTITNSAPISIVKDTTKQLNVSLNPADATDPVSYVTDKPDIVDVDESGVLHAKATGENVTITVISNGHTDQIIVNSVLPATSVTIAGNENITIHRGGSQQLSATVEPSGTTDELTWVSNNTNVATVDNDGTVHAVGKGTAKITARAGNYTDFVNVTVDAPITAFTSDETNISIVKGKEKTLQYTITPSDTTDSTTITWTSNDNNKVTVSNGKIKAVGEGSTTVTAQLGTREIIYNVTVTIIPVEGLTLNKDTLEVYKGKTDTSLKYTITPEDTTEATTVVWTSDEEGIATVDQNGKVTGVSAGTTTIRATMGTFSDSVEVTVIEVHLEGITLDKKSDTLEIGSTYKINVKLLPENTTDDVTFTYESSDPEIATVDENGVVKGKKTGKVTITVRSNIGDYETTIDLNVVIPEVAPNPKTGVKSVFAYLIASFVSLFGIIIVAKKRFN